MTDAIVFEKSTHGSMILPVMSLREVVMFPKSIVPLFVGRDSSIKAIEMALDRYEKRIFLVAQKDPGQERPDVEGLFEVGTVSKVLQMLRLPDGTIKVLFEGLYRASFDHERGLMIEDDIQMVRTSALPDLEGNPMEGEALVRATHEAVEEYSQVNRKLAKETILAITSVSQPGRLADSIAPHLKATYDRKQGVLELRNPVRRLERVYELIQEEVEVFSLEKKIKGRVKKQMEENQKDYYLGEQLKAIHKEMGRDFDPKADMEELEVQLKEKDMPEEARAKAMAEMKKLRQTPPSSAEYAVLRNYVDWILALPWNVVRDVDIDIKQAQKILDDDHYGLEKPKERILEYLAVQALVKKLRGPILCLVGPPGVGKTSLAKSIARATGREFVRLSLGGVRDEAEIRGHRRTYVGALPGKIIQSLKRVSTNNPVFCLDEVDKMSMDFRGDPSAALLEVLDPEQNSAFNDHYLDMDYDLSQVFFITTANSLQTIPLPLQDRMEIITIPGYLETEKERIASDFLLPKQLEQHGLKSENLSMSKGAILEVIRRYTRESGVRNMERELASVCRKVARALVEDGDMDKTVAVTKSMLGSYLGVPKVRHGQREEEAQVGVATGLAWTQVGGELLFVEVALMPGTGKIEITGKLGDVMQESAKAAISYIRSRSEFFGLRKDFYKEIDTHIHVPEGATPKDGPSAGITLATCLASALLDIPVRNDVAMTGEITLRGRVLPIGGVRDKLLAAHRGLITRVLLPKENERDLKEVPKVILKDLEIVFVENMDQVLCEALKDVTMETLFCPSADIIPVSKALHKGHEFSSPQ
ncbi:ATP-dependent proteinase. Serine peptidase. MEROPS family S16 [Desulfomicrobium apsheronum]|uniref:Lon protease n=1 Tax=Desulfomicrobium apsheronum TaxID=52560 RepID=A0A1I3U0Q1_9BACT|nr:endopeptidase La [Desulfomicrobium apsheronum]MDY0227061.1 endopeptidase La [Desulfomicrobium apsheronum]SFJ75361.1 ATP-dependent proteinase. Serine peptidase. MEROPS family S16 [Desulfomicrobium apsheronum]